MERKNIKHSTVGVVSFMLPLFAIPCLREMHVRVGSRVVQGADVLDGVRLHSSGSTWCGCIRVVFVCLLFPFDFALCVPCLSFGSIRAMDSETDMSDGEINQAGLSSLELWRMFPRGVQTTFGSDGALLPDDALAYLFDTEEEFFSLLRSILGEGAEGLLQARQELQWRAERTIHCLHKRRALVPSEIKMAVGIQYSKRQCVVASGVVQAVPGLAACGALRQQGRPSQGLGASFRRRISPGHGSTRVGALPQGTCFLDCGCCIARG